MFNAPSVWRPPAAHGAGDEGLFQTVAGVIIGGHEFGEVLLGYFFGSGAGGGEENLPVLFDHGGEKSGRLFRHA